MNSTYASFSQKNKRGQIAKSVCSPMIRREESWLLVLVTDRTEVATDDFKVCALSDVILRHLEHP